MQTALEEFDHDDEALHDEELVSVLSIMRVSLLHIADANNSLLLLHRHAQKTTIHRSYAPTTSSSRS